jgi:hypothetical protein
MRLRPARQQTSDELPFDMEYVPGVGIVRKLDQHRRWQLAGESSVTHRLAGPWYRRTRATCNTKGRCEFGRWSDDILIAEARRAWLGR